MKIIGIISAIEDEITLFLQSVKILEKVEIGKRTFYVATQNNIKIIIVFSRWGKVAAATTTTTLINKFEVSEIIFSGVAGAIAHQLNVGDIVVANELFQHDLDPRPLFKQFEIPLLNKTGIETDTAISTKIIKYANYFSDNEFNSLVSKSNKIQFNLQNPAVYTGIVISGDKFIANKEAANKISAKIPNTLCVEMEGAAVAQVCYEYEVPFTVIRVISDKADDSAAIDFPLFTKHISSIYANNILQQYLNHQ